MVEIDHFSNVLWFIFQLPSVCSVHDRYCQSPVKLWLLCDNSIQDTNGNLKDLLLYA